MIPTRHGSLHTTPLRPSEKSTARSQTLFSLPRPPPGKRFSHLLFPYAWVRLSACRIVGALFGHVPISAFSLTLGSDLAEAIISNSGGGVIELATLVDVTQKLCLQLRVTHLDEMLSMQVAKNLFYVGKTSALVYDQDPEAENEAKDEGEPKWQTSR
jgi:hypothetical protein